jgi:hypothetical protein
MSELMQRLAVVLAAALAWGVSPTTDPDPDAATATATATVGYLRMGAFSEVYQGRHLRGWDGPVPCAFIDGVALELIPHGNNRYSSVVRAYEVFFGVRAATRAAVRALGDAALRPADPPAQCGR